MPQGVSFFEGSQQESTVQIKNAPGLSGKGGGEHSTARGVIFCWQLVGADQQVSFFFVTDDKYSPNPGFHDRAVKTAAAVPYAGQHGFCKPLPLLARTVVLHPQHCILLKKGQQACHKLFFILLHAKEQCIGVHAFENFLPQ